MEVFLKHSIGLSAETGEKKQDFGHNSDTNLGEESMKSHPKRDSTIDANNYVICMRKASQNVTENGLKIQAYLEIVEMDSFAEIVVSY